MTRKPVTIRPTRHGYVFLLILAALLVGSANYNNNLGFLLTFLLASMLLVSIFHTRRNLTGLRISSVRVKPVFAGETAVFQLRIRAEHLPRVALEFSFESGEVSSRDFTTSVEQPVDVRLVPGQRGLFNPGLLTVSTRYPFGLIQCGFELDLQMECLVYPAPMPSANHWVHDYYRTDITGDTARYGADDFDGFKSYQPGDPLINISWKAFARGQGLLVKEFAENTTSAVLIDWFAIPEADVERKLSYMCDMLQKANRLKMSYGLRLPGKEIKPDDGERHQNECMRALALYGSRKGTS